MHATYSDAYYLDLQRRLTDLLSVVQERLTAKDRRWIAEFIEANECGLALETLVDALAARGVAVEGVEVAQIERLAATMGLPIEITRRLTVLA